MVTKRPSEIFSFADSLLFKTGDLPMKLLRTPMMLIALLIGSLISDARAAMAPHERSTRSALSSVALPFAASRSNPQ
jgi:hypothetical protein